MRTTTTGTLAHVIADAIAPAIDTPAIHGTELAQAISLAAWHHDIDVTVHHDWHNGAYAVIQDGERVLSIAAEYDATDGSLWGFTTAQTDANTYADSDQTDWHGHDGVPGGAAALAKHVAEWLMATR